jgi:methyltransferase of ATP-grasp peptide maturase system
VNHDWKTKAAGLADDLIATGKLTSPEWIAAVRETPRHVFVPRFYEQQPEDGEWREVRSDSDGLERIYSNTGLFTKIGADPVWDYTVGLSSTSTPSLMTRMLETLDIHDGHRVLEIGTGTGYNAALWCHRLGDAQVASVDIEPDLIEQARDRLNQLGYHPTLAATDGADGLAEHAPYDRIIATCAVPRVPWAWVEQLRDGGLALVDVKRATTAGNLVLLQRHGDRAEGRFDPRWGGFMAMRDGRTQQVQAQQRDRTSTAARPSMIGYSRPWDNLVAWFLAMLTMPANVTHGHTIDPATGQPGDIFLRSPDGSWAELSAQPDEHGHHLVSEDGPHRLWQSVEQAHTLWDNHERPSWDRLGLTITPTTQRVWIDTPNSQSQWDL